jgi:hypothetical protein
VESLRINYWSKKREGERCGRYPFSKKSLAASRDDCGENSQQRHSCIQIMNYYCTFTRKLLPLRKQQFA